MQRTRTVTTNAEEAIMERWQAEFRTERELDAHGFAGDDDVPLILGDMEDEVRMEDLRPDVVMTKSGAHVQGSSHYDRTRPRRAEPVAYPSDERFDLDLLNAEETGDDE